MNLAEAADFYQDTQILLEMLTGDGGKYMSISSLIPEEQDIESLQEGSYRLGKSSGFTDGIKRNSVYMVKSGACLNKAAVGALMKVGVSEGHDILRYGKGMYVKFESMKDFIDSREYRLTCISPVHIGSGETFKAFEYLYDRKNKKVGFIQEEKWQKKCC